MLWESKIELGEAFFNEIIRHPVPLNMNTLKALKRSAPWAWISTCGSPTGRLALFELRSGSHLEAVVPAVRRCTRDKASDKTHR